MQTLFERIGGKAAVDLAVDKFYDKVLADTRIQHFFDNMDMDKQREHQRAFLTYAFGGTNQYQGRSMREAHRGLVMNRGLNERHFRAVLENLEATLQELGVAPDLIAEVMAIAGGDQHRRDVLNLA
jgi:hemoglobin